MKKIPMIILVLFAVVLPLANAQISLESFTSSPEKVFPGEHVAIELVLRNVGEEDLENVIVALDVSQVPFAPSGSSNEKTFDEIDDHHSEIAYFTLQVLPTAEPQIYKIPVIVSYEDTSKETSVDRSKTSFISIEVEAQANLDVILGSSELIQSLPGEAVQKGKVSLKFVNKGLTSIKFLKVTLRESPLYRLLSPQTAYIGEVDVGDYESEEFLLSSALKNPILIIDLEYQDAANHLFQETRLLPLKTYSQEEAQLLGIAPQPSKLPFIEAVLIFGFVGFFLYKKIKKRKNSFSEAESKHAS